MIRYEHQREAIEVVKALTNAIIEQYDNDCKRPMTIALSGGSTPNQLFEYWANQPELIKEREIHFFWVDERMVPKSSTDSNYGTACRLFFDKVDFPQERLHPISFDPESSVKDRAASYSKELYDFNRRHGKETTIDLVILGMGEDGHTSSLFPGQDLFEEEETYIASVHPSNGIERVALSYRGIEEAENIAFLVLGEKKAERLGEVISTSYSDDEEVVRHLPSAYVINQASIVSIYSDIPPLIL